MTPIILRAVLLGACATLAVPAALAQCAGVAAGQTEQNAAADGADHSFSDPQKDL